MTGNVFNIQKFCTSDGPGIRTVVFLKGCPLRCAWCHNAESHVPDPELLFHEDKCTLCGRCTAVCPNHAHSIENGVHAIDRGNCKACGACTTACLCDALEVRGKVMEVGEVIAEVNKDALFYKNSGGGITLSGGEPFAQAEFTLALLEAAKAAGLHTCIETCGFTSEENIRRAVPYVDLFLWDIKHTEIEAHRRYTGADPVRIWQNLRLADELGADIVLRCPIIPGVNDTDAHFEGIAAIAANLSHVLYIELEPYHAFGNGKYDQLGKASATAFRVPDADEPPVWADKLRGYTGIEVRIAK